MLVENEDVEECDSCGEIPQLLCEDCGCCKSCCECEDEEEL